LQKINSNFSTIIINKNNYISFTSIRTWIYWPINIEMNNILLWELDTLFPYNLTHFLRSHMYDIWLLILPSYAYLDILSITWKFHVHQENSSERWCSRYQNK
jgi:hypothetical protein